MYKYLIFILILLSYSTPSNSKAMWEISDEWVCNREYSSKVIVDEDSDVAKRVKEHQGCSQRCLPESVHKSSGSSV